MTVVTRDLTITYGSTVVQPSDARFLDESVVITKNYRTVLVEFEFTIFKSAAADFATEIDTVEEAFRTPRQRLLITQEGETLHDWNPADNSGFDADPEIFAPPDDPRQTGSSRHYIARILISLPADLSGQAGRQDSNVELLYSCSRVRQLIITGTYTALNGNEAEAQYQSAIDAYATSLIGGLSGSPTMELSDEQTRANDTDKNIEFRRVYDELIANQSDGVLDNASIVRQRMFILRAEEAPGDSRGESKIGIVASFTNGAIKNSSGFTGNADRLLRLTVLYEACIDQNQTKDLKSLFDDTIQPHILSQLKAKFNAGTGALTFVEPEFNSDENILRARVEFVGLTTGSARVSWVQRQEIRNIPGNVLIPVYDGNPRAKYVHPGEERRIRTTTSIATDVEAGALGGGGGRQPGGVGGLVFGGIERGGLRQQNLGLGGLGEFGILGGDFSPGVQIIFPRNRNLPGNGVGGAPGGAPIIPQGTGWNIIDYREEKFPRVLGLNGDQISLIDTMAILIEEWAEAPAVGGRPSTGVEE